MKRTKPFVIAAVVALVAGMTAWQVVAQGQSPVPPPTSLSQWQYPDGSGFGTQLVTEKFPNFPYAGLQGKTNDSIEKVYAFYRKKATQGLDARHGFNWQSNAETTLLVNQPPNGEDDFSAMAVSRQMSDNALMIVHQPTQTAIIKLSRDAQDRSGTDISVVIDKH